MIMIRELEEKDILPISAAFASIGWTKPVSQYQRYLAEQSKGVRKVFVAFETDVFAGYLTVVWKSNYTLFAAKNIPEINDFNVLPEFRRKGIGTKLMDEAERIVSERSKIVGIGVGLNAGYGSAQRLYIKRGYIPDGRGIVRRNRFPKYGEQVTVDDDLNLYFTKILR
jgi:GNAT superfamily N-acetyltransferase